MNINPKIVLGIKHGSHQDFEEFYYQFNGKLYNFVMKLSKGDSTIAEDIVQNTFIKLWETREILDTQKSIITYVCTIARNLLLNHYKHQTIVWTYEDFILFSSSESDKSTEQQIELKFLENYIHSLVLQLPPACRRIYEMSRNERLKNKEIAKQLSISEKTVEGQLTKALSFLRKHLSKYIEILILLFALT